MSLREKMLEAGVRLALKVLVPLMTRGSDRGLGRLFRVLERLAWAATGDRMAAQPLADVADVFESGPPHSTRLRKLIGNVEPDMVVDGAKCLTRPSPYGLP